MSSSETIKASRTQQPKYNIIPTSNVANLASENQDENQDGKQDGKQDIENQQVKRTIPKSSVNARQSSQSQQTIPSYWKSEMSDNDMCYFWFGITTFLITIIIVTSTVSMSFHYIDYEHYGLVLNRYHGVRLKHIYTEGRYFLTLDDSMIYFYSSYQPIKFTSSTFSDNGLEFDLDISFYYKIPKDKLSKIYDLYSTSFEGKIESNAKQITKNIASTFSVEEFLTNRSYIENSIGKALEKQLEQTLDVYAPVDFFKIVSIHFPPILISKSLETAIALQSNEIAILQQTVNVINADTTQMISKITAQTNKVLQYAQSESNLITTNANSESINILLTTRTDGIELFCQKLNITNPHHINKINKIFGIIDNANNLTLFNTQNNIIVNA